MVLKETKPTVYADKPIYKDCPKCGGDMQADRRCSNDECDYIMPKRKAVLEHRH